MTQTFDFIVIGAGSAGCVLAEKLSADHRYSVALIEAGGTDRRLYVQMPLGYGKTFYDPSLNWCYQAEPDPGLDGQSDYWPRGKVLGGSGSINAMVWIRGARQDFDDWASAGNPGWAYADCLPYFRKMEHNEAGADEWRTQDGPLHVSDVSGHLHPLAQRFLDAGRQAGFSANADFNGATQEGFGVYQINTRNGRRMSAARAFLRPALRRGNLALFIHAHACRILLDGHCATGVEISRNRVREVLRARREVILAAGAVNSPQILHVSGIGPGAHLASLGLPVVHDSPAAGHFMQDHLGINYTYRSRIGSLNEVLRPWHGKVRAGLDFLLRGRGPLSLSLNQAGAFVRTRPDLARPDIQLYFQALSTFGAKSGTRPLLTPDCFPGFSLGLSTCRPESFGSILARSSDPFDPPRIMPNAFGTQGDVQTMLAGVKLLRRLAAQPALRDVIAAELAPGPAVAGDEALIADFRQRAGTVYHPACTCRLGPDPATAVVDGRLRLHGISGLRIADASAFPSQITGNINAAVMMLAARAAAMALEDAKN